MDKLKKKTIDKTKNKMLSIMPYCILLILSRINSGNILFKM